MNTYLAQLNLIALIVSTVIYFILGSLWYSPALLGKTWLKYQKTNPHEGKGHLPLILSATFVLSFIVCTGLAFLVVKTEVDTLLGGLKLGALCGFAFVFSTSAVNAMFDKKPLTLLLIDAGYHITGILISAVILAIWK